MYESLNKIKEKNYFVWIVLKNNFNVHGKIEAIGEEVITIRPYHYVITPFGDDENFFFKNVEDRSALIKLEEIVAVIPVPEEALDRIMKVKDQLMKEKKIGI